MTGNPTSAPAVYSLRGWRWGVGVHMKVVPLLKTNNFAVDANPLSLPPETVHSWYGGRVTDHVEHKCDKIR